MASPTPTMPDLFQSWKEMYDRFETTWATSVNEVLESDSFAQNLAATRENFLKSQKLTKEQWEQHWATMRIPTKTDLATLAGQIHSVERKVEGLEDTLETLESSLTRLERKLDLLLAAPAPVAAPVATPVATEAPAAAKPRTTTRRPAPKA